MKKQRKDKVPQSCPSIQELYDFASSSNDPRVKQHLKRCKVCNSIYAGIRSSPLSQKESKKEIDELIKRILEKSKTTDHIDALAAYVGLDDTEVKALRAAMDQDDWI